MGCCSSRQEAFEEIYLKYISQIPIYNLQAVELNNLISDFAYNDPVSEKILTGQDIMEITSGMIKKGQSVVNLKDLPLSFKKDTNYNLTLTETNMKDFIYKYLIIENFEDASFNYFFGIYNEIPHNMKYPMIKLILILLFCSKDSKSNQKVLVENLDFYAIYSYKNEYKSDTQQLKNYTILTKYLESFLKIYIKAISLIAINNLFKPLLKQNHNKIYGLYGNKEDKIMLDRKEYEDLFSSNNINKFIRQILKKDLDKQVISIELFIKENYYMLIDHTELLKRLSDINGLKYS